MLRRRSGVDGSDGDEHIGVGRHKSRRTLDESGTTRSDAPGIAAMKPKDARHICSMGGTKAHEIGTAHRFTHAEAVAAGRKGGQARRQRQAV